MKVIDTRTKKPKAGIFYFFSTIYKDDQAEVYKKYFTEKNRVGKTEKMD